MGLEHDLMRDVLGEKEKMRRKGMKEIEVKLQKLARSMSQVEVGPT